MSGKGINLQRLARPLADRAARNLKKWGPQDFQTLGLAVCEEAGELAQAILQERHECGKRDRIREEAIDLGALCLQIMAHFPSRPNSPLCVLTHSGEDAPDARCPTCRQRDSHAGERDQGDGTVRVWRCNVPGCANGEDDRVDGVDLGDAAARGRGGPDVVEGVRG